MASTIKLKNGSGAPLSADLVTAEPALDLTNKRLYTEDSGGNVIEVGTNPTEIQIDNINIDGNAITSTDTNGNIAITPNGTGEVDISKVDIDGGAIDGTTIGGTTTAAGSFTTLQADTSLNVDGTVTADENITIDTSSGGNGLTIQASGDTSNAITVDSNRSGAGSAINQFVGKWNGTDVTDIRFLTGSDTTNKDDGEIAFLTSSAGTLNNAMLIDSSGNVGIGTTNPGASLDIANTTLDEQFRVGNGSAFRYLHLVGGATSISDVPNSEAMIAVADANFSGVTGAGDTGFLVYRPRVDSSSSRSGHAFFTGSPSTERMRIDSSGLVDIGDRDSGSAGVVGKQIQSSQDFSTTYSGSSPSTWAGMQLVNHDDTANRTAVGVTFVHRSSSSGQAGIQSTSDAADRADIRFATRNASGINERVIIDYDGNLDLTSGGGNIIMSNGAGIDFSASEGGGASSSILDDYEEGTFTPQFNDDGGGGDFASAGVTAKYTKVGRLVTIHLWVNGVTNSGSVSISGNLKLDDLPFTCDAGVAGTSIIRARNISSGEVFRAEVSQSTTSIIFYKDSTETRAATSDLLYANGGTNDRVIITLSYLAA